ncbi:phospholipase A2 inhibitor beta-like [Chironomus tepperi]|uniref:phospholipase A2 inhibitor beta-like n=1 Tax=Chironomus tepperi TaxID=113505 RepID=UPI00391F9264
MCCNGLKELNQENLKPFSKLTILTLDKNEIQILEEGVFDYNLELVIIDLDSNKLVHIDISVFDNLAKLTFLGLNLNICINSFGNSTSTVDDVINKAEYQCIAPEFEALKALEAEIKSDADNNQPDFKEKVEKLETNFQNSSLSQNLAIKQRIEVLSEWKMQGLWTIKEELKSVRKHNAEILEIMNKQSAEIDEMSIT